MSELKLVIASAFAAAASALSALACTLVEFYNPVLFDSFCSIPDDVQILLWLLSVIFALTALLGLAVSWKEDPFKYPYLAISFDVSRRKEPFLENELEDWLCDDQNWETAKGHLVTVKSWKQDCGEIISSSWCPNHRFEQYLAAIDDDNMYCVSLTRDRTGYRQRNYVRTSYTYTVLEDSEHFSFEELSEIRDMLEETGYECNLYRWRSKEQRRFMTPELRHQIMERDGYTCQMCGRYMPDGTGIHIDHIIPVSKGGKTVPGNLQVLCAKCNLSKGARILPELSEESAKQSGLFVK